MFLSEFTLKSVYVGKNLKGVCLGIGVSLKTATVKYLLCASETTFISKTTQPDFAVSLSCVKEIGDVIRLSTLRPIHPKSYAKFILGLPIYSSEGFHLGFLQDVEIQNQTALRLITDKEASFSPLNCVACTDAVILRKEAPFPIGQRIPAPEQQDLNAQLVTKSVLKTAIKKGRLIRFTLSLSPFYFASGVSKLSND